MFSILRNVFKILIFNALLYGVFDLPDELGTLPIKIPHKTVGGVGRRVNAKILESGGYQEDQGQMCLSVFFTLKVTSQNALRSNNNNKVNSQINSAYCNHNPYNAICTLCAT